MSSQTQTSLLAWIEATSYLVRVSYTKTTISEEACFSPPPPMSQ